MSSTEIKKMLKSSNVIIGTERTIKALKLGKLQKVLMSSNCPANVEKDINYYAGLGGGEVYKLEHSNEELSVICKKPYSISVLGVLSEKD